MAGSPRTISKRITQQPTTHEERGRKGKTFAPFFFAHIPKGKKKQQPNQHQKPSHKAKKARQRAGKQARQEAKHESWRKQEQKDKKEDKREDKKENKRKANTPQVI